MFSEKMIDQMRYELEHPEVMQERINKEKEANKFIALTKERFIAEGRDLIKSLQSGR
jgi:hypothetical protein